MHRVFEEIRKVNHSPGLILFPDIFHHRPFSFFNTEKGDQVLISLGYLISGPQL